MVLLVLVCSVVCIVLLSSLIRCALSCLRSVSSDASANSSARGSINNGVKKKALKTFPVVKYSADSNLPGLETECVICLSDFATGERLRILPKCNNGFHIRCIDKWLRLHSSCTKCRRCVIETCEKIVGSSQDISSTSGSSMPQQDPVVSIRPLEPERIVSTHGELR